MKQNPLNPNCMNAEQLSLVLCISLKTVIKLEKEKQIPSFQKKSRTFFCFSEVLEYLKSIEGGVA